MSIAGIREWCGAGSYVRFQLGVDTPRSGGRLEVLREQLLGQRSPSRDVRVSPQLGKGMAMTIVDSTRPVIGGVDTHLDEHVAAVVDGVGGLIGVARFPVTPAGYRRLVAWMRGHGRVERVGVEGTGSYGAGLARHMLADGLVVLEVTRPNRQERHRNGKDDDLDAVEAVRAVIAGRALATAKTSTGNTEALRVLLGAQRSANRVQLRHLMFTAPDELRECYAKLSRKELTAQCARAHDGDVRPLRDRAWIGDDVGCGEELDRHGLRRRATWECQYRVAGHVEDHPRVTRQAMHTTPPGRLDPRGSRLSMYPGSSMLHSSDRPPR